ncbi:unnamed protein product [Adineta steineri]|uniref:Uncharacterized protein n=1 Tax=Adineta steineri TaxID=433720 RepID=A0A815WPW6_9BILA|nr:unnamed protein product [Adineta steineri]CAF1548139.1 unnamed protein product [Adineta steineri]
MNCKLSKDSLIELQLIRPELMSDDAPCPCCEQRVNEHRNGRRIGRIPFTCYNICPRMKRASRKSSVVRYMMINYSRLIFLLMGMIICQHSLCIADKFRVYEQPSGQLCYWQGDAPFCFIGSGCPIRTTNMGSSKFGDGAYCWIGVKFYCCV